jgi:hypothetical protein
MFNLLSGNASITDSGVISGKSLNATETITGANITASTGLYANMFNLLSGNASITDSGVISSKNLNVSEGITGANINATSKSYAPIVSGNTFTVLDNNNNTVGGINTSGQFTGSEFRGPKFNITNSSTGLSSLTTADDGTLNVTTSKGVNINGPLTNGIHVIYSTFWGETAQTEWTKEMSTYFKATDNEGTKRDFVIVSPGNSSNTSTERSIAYFTGIKVGKQVLFFEPSVRHESINNPYNASSTDDAKWRMQIV